MKPFLKGIVRLSLVLLLTFALVTPIQALGNPVKISTSTNQTVFPQTVADSNGYLHLVWMEVATETEIWGGHQNPGIFYSRWNGDTWSAPLKISENTGFAEIPSIAADGTDTIHVTWDDETYGASGRVAYKTRSSGGTWSTIETLPIPTGALFGWNSRVATDNTNAPHVAFSSGSLAGDSIYWTKKVSGAWSAPELVSKDAAGNNITDTQWSDLRQDNSGNIHLIYQSWGQGVFYRKYSGGTWSTPILVSLNAGYTRMAITPGGEVFITWHNGNTNAIEARWTQSGGTWQPETTLATNAEFSFFGFPIMGVTTDSKERAHVGWGEKDAGGLIDLRYRSFVPGSGWQAVQDVDLDNNDADSPVVYPDKWDNQHFAWTEKNPSNGNWEIMYRVAEGTIQTVGSGGGTITANPGNVTYVTLNVPSGALSVNTEIGIQIGPVPENVNPTQVTIPRAFTFRPHGLVFNATGTATFFYTDSEIGAADERELKPWVWNSQTNAWEARTGSVNRAQNRIAVSLSGFSLFGISAPIVNTNWVAPQKDETIKQAAWLFEFTLNYADGSEIVAPASADELTVKLKNGSGEVVKILLFEPRGINKDEGKKIYKGTLQFQKDGIPNGDYTLEVYLADSLVGSQTFNLLR